MISNRDRVRMLNFFKKHPMARTAKLKNWEDQTYTDVNGEYRVGDILRWAEENVPLRKFNIGELAENAFRVSSEETGDEVPGSEEFVERAMKSDFKYPIVVVRYSDGDFIADGVHRLWKARAVGEKTIKGYLIRDTDLGKI